jgi:hypothetical protein
LIDSVSIVRKGPVCHRGIDDFSGSPSVRHPHTPPSLLLPQHQWVDRHGDELDAVRERFVEDRRDDVRGQHGQIDVPGDVVTVSGLRGNFDF